jgi:GxxExxY protein
MPVSTVKKERCAFVGKHADLTGKIIGAFFDVYSVLGYGFLEKVYENALALELRKMGLRIEQQKRITVYYDGQEMGEYFADIVVNGIIIVELKAVRQLLKEHEAQLLNYLKATTIEVGLLLNFGPKAKFERKVYDNDRKGSLTWTEKQDTRKHE